MSEWGLVWRGHKTQKCVVCSYKPPGLNPDWHFVILWKASVGIAAVRNHFTESELWKGHFKRCHLSAFSFTFSFCFLLLTLPPLQSTTLICIHLSPHLLSSAFTSPSFCSYFYHYFQGLVMMCFFSILILSLSHHSALSGIKMISSSFFCLSYQPLSFSPFQCEQMLARVKGVADPNLCTSLRWK